MNAADATSTVDAHRLTDSSTLLFLLQLLQLREADARKADGLAQTSEWQAALALVQDSTRKVAATATEAEAAARRGATDAEQRERRLVRLEREVAALPQQVRSLTQFAPAPSLPLSLTVGARKVL
jgi:hypothetical protein